MSNVRSRLHTECNIIRGGSMNFMGGGGGGSAHLEREA